jgi:glycine cleavage system aminomethyltransferase T
VRKKFLLAYFPFILKLRTDFMHVLVKSFMAKFLVKGRDAGDFLNRLSTANVDKENGKITYTQWLNEDGLMEADLTVTRINEEEFLVVATDTMQHHAG